MAKERTVQVSAVALVVLWTSLSSASAQQAACSALLQQGCFCVAQIAAGGSPGQLNTAQGNVVLSGRANFTPAAPPMSLKVGDSILVGPDGVAAVNFGATCYNKALPASSTASVSAVNGCACLTVQQNAAASPRAGGNGGAIAAVAGGGAALAALVAAQNKKPDSP